MRTPTQYLEALDSCSFRAVGGRFEVRRRILTLTSAQITKDFDDDEVSIAFGFENLYRR